MRIDRYIADSYGGSDAISVYKCKLCNLGIAKSMPKFVVSSRELRGSRLVQSERVLCSKCYEKIQIRTYNRNTLSNTGKRRAYNMRKTNILKVVG